MPLIRCPKCGQAYDIPGVVAVRLPNSIATCQCGEWLSGSKAAVLARLVDASQIKEVDLSPYKVSEGGQAAAPPALANDAPARPRSVRIIARGAKESVNTVFTIHQTPLWIGRKGCHIELAEADLSIRHCSISVRGDKLVVKDANSHMGTFLDGQRIEEAAIDDGVHILRVGSALVSVEPTTEPGKPVEPMRLDDFDAIDEAELAVMALAEPEAAAPARVVLVAVEGPLLGQEFEVPPTGLIVGREGHVRVPDEFLSRKHFEVYRDPEGATRVRDLGSRNGTTMNSLPANNVRIRGGDVIEAGLNRFRIDERE